ncbi:hypothetical protein [Streptomyces sp. NWU339]|uniref:hypothetical protein n=1 Tax=Streptomyces sp. NWU339 TaxID=2185284 RepID=UPI0015E7EA44|nr:hypothetical protein [Streptomyces sp. NWU339]
MPSLLPPCGLPCLSADAVNDAMRRLMRDEPDTPERRETYRRLLERWCALTRGDVEPAA